MQWLLSAVLLVRFLSCSCDQNFRSNCCFRKEGGGFLSCIFAGAFACLCVCIVDLGVEVGIFFLWTSSSMHARKSSLFSTIICVSFSLFFLLPCLSRGQSGCLCSSRFPNFPCQSSDFHLCWTLRICLLAFFFWDVICFLCLFVFHEVLLGGSAG